MKDERGRGGIEQLRIVDAEHHRTTPGARAEFLATASQQRHDVVGANLVRNQIGDGRQRNRRRAARALDPADERPVALGGRLRLADQARLAHAGVRRPQPLHGIPRSARADAIASSSRSRPTSGHARPAQKPPAGPQACVPKNFTIRLTAAAEQGEFGITRTGRASPTRGRHPARRTQAARHPEPVRTDPRPESPTRARAPSGRRASASRSARARHPGETRRSVARGRTAASPDWSYSRPRRLRRSRISGSNSPAR